MSNFFRLLTMLFMILVSAGILAQKNVQDPEENFGFKILYEIEATDVKDQYRTGTCWSFATTSFIESEMIKAGRPPMDLSEMFFVRYTYPRKALKYIRNHGKANFSAGGQAHDVIFVLKNQGMIPEKLYPGFCYEEERHNQGELDAVLKGFLDALNKNRGGRLSPAWSIAFNAILDAYLGNVPLKFEYGGKEYSPGSFAESSGLDPDEYIEFTSYSNFPYYTQALLEVPENWSHDTYYNVPLEEFVEIAEHALKEGYSLVWDGDVSDRYFSGRNGFAIVPEKAWKDKTKKEREHTFKYPEKQKDISHEERQKAFENRTSTDDHLMHIVGLVKDKKGVKYFKAKDSSGPDSNSFGGYIYMSESYFRLGTLVFMVNRNALSPEMKEKLGFD